MITTRDQSMLNFLEDFHIATSGQLHRIFFPNASYQYSSKRLRYLTDQGHIKRTRSTIDNSYAYYVNKPVQIHHDLIRAELYTALKGKYDVLEWHNEFTIEHIRPDALAYIQKGIVYPVLIEIHLSNQFDFDKYKMDFLPIFGMKPIVIICTDRPPKLPLFPLKFKVIGLDMSGLDALFK